MIHVNLVIDVSMGRVRAPARLWIYVSERQEVFTTRCRNQRYLLWPSLPRYGPSLRLINKIEHALTPYALQEKKPFMSFVKERSLSYFPTTSRKSSPTLT